MPLIDLQTNLKNLRFGNDQPGYGSSGLPYIQTQIPDTPNATGTFKPLFRPGSTGNLDYPIRGGQLEFQLGSQTFTLSSQLDKTRIRKFFEDAPRGKAFLDKQVGLQFSNPKIETGNTLFGIPQAFPFPGIVENTRIYNSGANTLAQVGVSGTGAHATRSGLVPFNPFQKFYYDIVNSQNVENQSQTNRLLILKSLKMTTSANNPFVNPTNVPDINRVNTLGISLNRNLLFQYLGGPGSAYGIGGTTIRRTVDTTKLRSVTAMSYDQISGQKSNFGTAAPQIQDFRAKINESLNSNIFPNAWTKEQTTDYKFFINKKDKLNLLYPFVFNNDVAPWEFNKFDTEDTIKFVFEAVSNDNPSYSTALFFRAFLTSGLNDNNSAQLNAFKYMGRGENFYTYQGFDRSISFAFRVYAGSRDELKPMYNRVNNLLSQVYPDYSPSTNIMRAPLVRLTIGDYLYRVPGFLENVNISVANDYSWEVNLEKSQLGDIAQLPHVIDISVSFKPIFDVLPKRASFGIKDSTRTYRDTQNSDIEITQQEKTAILNSTPLIANTKEEFITNATNRLSLSVQESSISERLQIEQRFQEDTLEIRQQQDLQSTAIPFQGFQTNIEKQVNQSVTNNQNLLDVVPQLVQNTLTSGKII
jgi:hypothetical protein